jgi:hypothetical protein
MSRIDDGQVGLDEGASIGTPGKPISNAEKSVDPA